MAAPTAFVAHVVLPSRSTFTRSVTSLRQPPVASRRAVALRPHAASPPQMGLDLARARRTFAAVAAAALLALAPAHDADAARGGGRVGGSSFRAPAAAQQGYAPAGAASAGYGYGGGYGGGGMFFGPSMFYTPLLIGGGGGALGTVAVVGAAGALAYSVLRERQEEAEIGMALNPDTAVVTVKVGLLATARQLQVDLDNVARSADTSTVRGLRSVLEEAVLTLLRNPDRWVYGSCGVTVGKFSESEDVFNRVCMTERLKIGEETLTNVGGRSVERGAATDGADVGEYIVVSLICAATDEGLSKQIPKVINGPEDLNRALGMVGGVATECLQGVEIIWAPQNLRDTLTEKEMLADHPELRMI